MSKQDIATARWEKSRRLGRIRDLSADTRDYSFPAGQLQAGIQLGAVEVPWLLNYIEELEERLNDSRTQPAQEVGLHPLTG